MYVARTVLKQNAKDQLRGIWGIIIAAMLLTVVIMGLINGLNQLAASREVYALSILLSLGGIAVTPIFFMGWTITCLRRISYQPIEALTPIKEGANIYVPGLVLFILMYVFTFLWSLLLIVPGIIKALSYSMAPYILAENRNMKPIDAITASKKMMNGHKSDCFVLVLSFIGWWALVALTLGILYFYVTPYCGQTLANFYKMLQAEAMSTQQSQNTACTPPQWQPQQQAPMGAQPTPAAVPFAAPAVTPAAAPAAAPIAAAAAAAASLVSEGITRQGNNTYETYQANNAVEAREFLAGRTVTEPLYYLIVKTPEGNWGKDKEGLFLEKLLPFQSKIELGTCEAIVSPGPDMTNFNVAAAQRGVVDNFAINLTCGACGAQWVDGVRYQNKTVVRCPQCGKLNIADTTNITAAN